MAPYFASAKVLLFGGIFDASFQFERGLNFLCGENGTGKTQLLRGLKNGQVQAERTGGQPRLLAFSPKRNSVRKTVDAIVQEVRSQSQNIATYTQRRLGTDIQDGTFDSYASFGELYFYMFEQTRKDGTRTPIHVMDEVTRDFNSVIGRIFEGYWLVSEWDPSNGAPRLQLRKRNAVINLEALSLGEQEILSLAVNVFAQRDSFDVVLIDEPEVHLNWHLEERLFDFLDWFGSEYDRQLIVTTHSRAVFLDRFLHKVTFLFWEGIEFAPVNRFHRNTESE